MAARKLSKRDKNWFCKQQKDLGLSNNRMAEMLSVTTCHIEHMRSGRRMITEATKRLIEANVKLVDNQQ
jgi:plasmid maintenance system antidote protein VapI